MKSLLLMNCLLFSAIASAQVPVTSDEGSCNNDTIRINLTSPSGHGGQTFRGYDAVNIKLFNTRMSEIGARLDNLESASRALSERGQCLEAKYSQSCKDWPKETVGELRKSGDYKTIVDELMKDPAFVEAVSESVRAKIEKNGSLK